MNSNQMLRPVAKINLLRALAGFWVSISLFIVHLSSSDTIGHTLHSENGTRYVSAGSHPGLVAWATVSIALFVYLMKVDVEEFPAGVPSGWTRFFAFLIDLWFSFMVLASIGGIVPLLMETQRTGHFSWHFERNYAVPSDEIIQLPLTLITMALMFLYFVQPLTQGKQTVGCFVMRLRVAPPYGTKGAFTFRAAIRRVWLEFAGMGSFILRRNDRDSQGRTWYDRATNSTVILVKYEE